MLNDALSVLWLWARAVGFGLAMFGTIMGITYAVLVLNVKFAESEFGRGEKGG
jgi:hypothetical protein